MAKSKETEMPTINLLSNGTSLKGDLNLSGDFRIDGVLNGTINCKGRVVVGETGSVEGEIVCQNADFSGKIKAQVKVSELLTLKESAKFTGDITTKKLAIEPGAQFSGTCQMEGMEKENIHPKATVESQRSQASPQ